MLAKLTSKNQLTLPRAAVEAAGSPEYFEIDVRAGQLVLTPVRIQRADAVRARLAQLHLGDNDLGAAVAWARQAASAPKAAPAGVAEARPAYARSASKKPAAARKPRSR